MCCTKFSTAVLRYYSNHFSTAVPGYAYVHTFVLNIVAVGTGIVDTPLYQVHVKNTTAAQVHYAYYRPIHIVPGTCKTVFVNKKIHIKVVKHRQNVCSIWELIS